MYLLAGTQKRICIEFAIFYNWHILIDIQLHEQHVATPSKSYRK